MTPATQHLPFTERRLVTPLLRLLAGRLSLDVDGIRLLEVRGRHSGTWHTTPLKVLSRPDQQRLQPAGWLLVAGALVSLAAGATPSMYDLYTSQTPQHFLQLLADRSTTWVAVHLAFLAGIVLLTLGLAALTSALADSRGKTLATIGLTLFLVATPIRVLQTIFAATVTVTAADQTTHSGVVPPAYQLLEGFLWGQPTGPWPSSRPSPASAWPATAPPPSPRDA